MPLAMRPPQLLRQHFDSLSPSQPSLSRQALLMLAATVSFTPFGSLAAQPIQPPTSIKERLDSQNPSFLVKPRNSGLSAPAEARYPDWLEGEWSVEQTFAGYEMPVKDIIPRDTLMAEADVPGFKKLSIAFLPDVGKEGVRFTMRWVRDADGFVREDRAANMNSAIRGGLGYDAIDYIDYKTDRGNPGLLGSNAGNPNRLKLVFAPGLTKNADRIEIFVNARETEAPREDLFYTTEALKQVTFSPQRSINGEYGHFISYRRVSPTQVDVVMITASYSEPLQLERFFQRVGGNQPLILFSHAQRMRKKEA